MAKQTGTATDYQNMLSILQTFANANGWTTERYVDSTEDELILRGDGDATDEIYVGIKTYSNVTFGYYNWELRGYTGYNSGLAFDAQPGVTSTGVYVPMQNASMDYWLWATGRRLCGIIKTGSSYQFFYLGFIDQYATDTEYTYPLMIMGSTASQERVFNSNSLDYSSSVNPAGTAANPTAWLMSYDNIWFPVYNFSGTTAESQSSVSSQKVSVWPHCRDYAPGGGGDRDNNVFGTNNDFNEDFRSNTAGGVSSKLIFRSENHLATPMAPVIPTILFTGQNPSIHFGELHNVYTTYLADTVSAEDVITDGVAVEDYIVFNNIHRTDGWCGIAIKDV